VQRWIQRDVDLLANPKTLQLGTGPTLMARLLLWEELLAVSLDRERGGILRPIDLAPDALAIRMAPCQVPAEDIPGHLEALVSARFLAPHDGACLRIKGWSEVYPSWKPNGDDRATCEVCGQPFQVSKWNSRRQKFCSSACRQKAHRDRQKQPSRAVTRNDATVTPKLRRYNDPVTAALRRHNDAPFSVSAVNPDGTVDLQQSRNAAVTARNDRSRRELEVPPTAVTCCNGAPEAQKEEEEEQERHPEPDPDRTRPSELESAMLTVGIVPILAKELCRNLAGTVDPADIPKLAAKAKRASKDPSRSAGLLASWLRSGTWETHLQDRPPDADDELPNGAGRIWGASPTEAEDWNRRMRAPMEG